jgi:hypothetical protein
MLCGGLGDDGLFLTGAESKNGRQISISEDAADFFDIKAEDFVTIHDAHKEGRLEGTDDTDSCQQAVFTCDCVEDEVDGRVEYSDGTVDAEHGNAARLLLAIAEGTVRI